ncbi:MAG: DUF3987 domain-containing protein [Flavobacteriales bacterium]
METQYKFSVYNAPIKNINPIGIFNLEDVHKKLIADKYKTITETLRQTANKEQQNEIKASQLDYVTFSGIFTKRANNGLVQHSSLFCIDLDNLNNVEETKSSIIELLPPSLMFLSPSGKGLKIVYKININDATHLVYFKAFEQFFKQQMNVVIDEKCKDIPRACFLCYDSEAYLNNEAEVLDISFIDTFYTEAEKEPQNAPTEVIKEILTEHDVIIDKLKTWLNSKMSFVNGNRNQYITQLAGAYNRYGIPQQIAESDLLSYTRSDFKENEIKGTVKSIYNQTSWHNTAKFEVNTPYEFTVNEVEVIEPTPLLPINGFPEYLQGFINEYVEVYNVPRDYIAASVLFSTAFAIGNKLELKGRYNNIPLLWLSIIGNVSSGKTAPLSCCMSYFNDLDEKNHKKYQKDKADWKAAKEQARAEKIDFNEPEPVYFQYVLNDFTPEALAQTHIINNRGLCIYRDEIKGWLDDFGRYSKSGEQSNMLSSFYREPIKYNRATKDPIVINAPTIFVAGGLQPDLLPTLAEDNRAENGFLSRMIFAYPDLQIKQNYSNKKLSVETIKNYHKYLATLTDMTDIVDISLSNEAETIYANWFNDNAKKTNDEPTGYLKGVYGKLDVISLRLAIVVQGMGFVCNQNTSTEINATTMQTAIELTEYFRATALKVYHKIFVDSGNSNMNKKDVIKYLSSIGASQNEIATALKVSQPYVNKILK